MHTRDKRETRDCLEVTANNINLQNFELYYEFTKYYNSNYSHKELYAVQIFYDDTRLIDYRFRRSYALFYGHYSRKLAGIIL